MERSEILERLRGSDGLCFVGKAVPGFRCVPSGLRVLQSKPWPESCSERSNRGVMPRRL
jgi:hypothetical protein